MAAEIQYSSTNQTKRGQKQLYTHPYENLGGASKGFYIKSFEVNFYSKLILLFNAFRYKNILKYHCGHKMHHFNIYTRNIGNSIVRKVIPIRIIAPFINPVIENHQIEGMNKFCKIIYHDLRMDQLLRSYSIWQLYENSPLNTEQTFLGCQKVKLYMLQIFIL